MLRLLYPIHDLHAWLPNLAAQEAQEPANPRILAQPDGRGLLGRVDKLENMLLQVGILSIYDGIESHELGLEYLGDALEGAARLMQCSDDADRMAKGIGDYKVLDFDVGDLLESDEALLGALVEQ